jgi:BirA family biotin operon repressor/biotin-[acetyl-CoA-carboxylase] ligase
VKYNVEIFDVLDSTNKYFEEMDTSSVAEGSVVCAKSQRCGVGQQGNMWESEEGKNLNFSILLKPTFLPISDRYMLTKVVSLAMIDFLNKEIPGEPISIKWPNDIYVGQKKICGILISNKFRANCFNTAIVGIGFNLNQTMFGKDIPNPISLKMITGKDYDPSVMLSEILSSISVRYRELQYGKTEDLDGKYLENLLYLNKERQYFYKDTLVIGTITGVGQEGFLHLETSDNKTIVCNLKELRFIH